jgi:flagellar hook-basal body complex protein FliE
MNSLPAITTPGSISGISGSPASQPQSATIGKSFSRLLEQANQQQLSVDRSVEDIAGGGSTSLHNVVISATKADLTFRMLIEMRNKLVESWHEIMRMQI